MLSQRRRTLLRPQLSLRLVLQLQHLHMLFGLFLEELCLADTLLCRFALVLLPSSLGLVVLVASSLWLCLGRRTGCRRRSEHLSHWVPMDWHVCLHPPSPHRFAGGSTGPAAAAWSRSFSCSSCHMRGSHGLGWCWRRGLAGCFRGRLRRSSPQITYCLPAPIRSKQKVHDLQPLCNNLLTRNLPRIRQRKKPQGGTRLLKKLPDRRKLRCQWPRRCTVSSGDAKYRRRIFWLSERRLQDRQIVLRVTPEISRGLLCSVLLCETWQAADSKCRNLTAIL